MKSIVTGRYLFTCLLVIIMMQAGRIEAAELHYSIGSNGLPEVTCDGTKVFRSQMPFWGPDWKYASVSLAPAGGRLHHWQGTARGGLSFKVDITWSTSGKHGLIGTCTFDVPQTTAPAIGGGFEFNLPLAAFKKYHHGADPVLLDDGAGWQWQLAPGKTLRITFSPKLPQTYFERGNRSRIRCMVFDKTVPAGKHTFAMHLELPAGSQYRKSAAERYGAAGHDGWIKDALDPVRSFVDLSYLNHQPAGKYGMVRVEGDRFVLGNGKPIRFWGTNIQAYTLFMKDRELIKLHAKRLAALGFNLVRLHHMDSQNWVKPCLIKVGPTTQDLDPDALDTYFYWIKCLKDEGIYVWVDLHVGRPLRQADNVPGFDELQRKARNQRVGPEVKGYCYVNDRIKELMREFNRKLLTTVNPYTSLALKDEPAVMTFMLTNENDLTHHFGNALLADKNVPFHNKLFNAEVAKFAQKTGLNVSDLQKTWQPGVSKLLLNDMEYHWSADMIGCLRKLGITQPIDTTQMWGGNSLCSLPALTAGDMIDVHSYYHGDYLTRSPRGGGGAIDYFARSQVAGMPLTITEWNNEDARHLQDSFVFPILVAAVAAFQGWDAPMIYGYSQDALREGRMSDWSVHNVPTTLGVMPALALLYRDGHVRTAERTLVAKLSRETLFMQGQAEAEPAFSTLSMVHRVVVALPEADELPWLKASHIPVEATVFTDLRKDFIPAGQDDVESDTGELRRDWAKGMMTINTEKTQAALGWIKNETIKLRDIAIRVDNPKGAVIVTSLDNKPIAASQRILITAVARLDRKRGLSEPVSGTVQIVSKSAHMTLSPLAGDGSEKSIVALKKRNRAFVVELRPEMQTHWFILKTK